MDVSRDDSTKINQNGTEKEDDKGSEFIKKDSTDANVLSDEGTVEMGSQFGSQDNDKGHRKELGHTLVKTDVDLIEDERLGDNGLLGDLPQENVKDVKVKSPSGSVEMPPQPQQQESGINGSVERQRHVDETFNASDTTSKETSLGPSKVVSNGQRDYETKLDTSPRDQRVDVEFKTDVGTRHSPVGRADESSPEEKHDRDTISDKERISALDEDVDVDTTKTGSLSPGVLPQDVTKTTVDHSSPVSPSTSDIDRKEGDGSALELSRDKHGEMEIDSTKPTRPEEDAIASEKSEKAIKVSDDTITEKAPQPLYAFTNAIPVEEETTEDIVADRTPDICAVEIEEDVVVKELEIRKMPCEIESMLAPSTREENDQESIKEVKVEETKEELTKTSEKDTKLLKEMESSKASGGSPEFDDGVVTEVQRMDEKPMKSEDNVFDGKDKKDIEEAITFESKPPAKQIDELKSAVESKKEDISPPSSDKKESPGVVESEECYEAEAQSEGSVQDHHTEDALDKLKDGVVDMNGRDHLTGNVEDEEGISEADLIGQHEKKSIDVIQKHDEETTSRVGDSDKSVDKDVAEVIIRSPDTHTEVEKDHLESMERREETSVGGDQVEVPPKLRQILTEGELTIEKFDESKKLIKSEDKVEEDKVKAEEQLVDDSQRVNEVKEEKQLGSDTEKVDDEVETKKRLVGDIEQVHVVKKEQLVNEAENVDVVEVKEKLVDDTEEVDKVEAHEPLAGDTKRIDEGSVTEKLDGDTEIAHEVESKELLIDNIERGSESQGKEQLVGDIEKVHEVEAKEQFVDDIARGSEGEAEEQLVGETEKVDEVEAKEQFVGDIARGSEGEAEEQPVGETEKVDEVEAKEQLVSGTEMTDEGYVNDQVVDDAKEKAAPIDTEHGTTKIAKSMVSLEGQKDEKVVVGIVTPAVQEVVLRHEIVFEPVEVKTDTDEKSGEQDVSLEERPTEEKYDIEKSPDDIKSITVITENEIEKEITKPDVVLDKGHSEVTVPVEIQEPSSPRELLSDAVAQESTSQLVDERKLGEIHSPPADAIVESSEVKVASEENGRLVDRDKSLEDLDVNLAKVDGDVSDAKTVSEGLTHLQTDEVPEVIEEGPLIVDEVEEKAPLVDQKDDRVDTLIQMEDDKIVVVVVATPAAPASERVQKTDERVEKDKDGGKEIMEKKIEVDICVPPDVIIVPSTKMSDISLTKIEVRDGDHDSGVDESTQGKETLEESPTKPSSLGKSPSSSAKGIVAASPAKKISPTTASTQSPAKAKAAGSTPSKTSATPTPPPQDKKLPMNKIVVGTSPSPNLKVVRSKIGSMENVKHRAGGGQVKMETKKIDLTNVKSKVGSTDNIQHKPTGGEKKVITRKLEWKAQSKVGSLDNAAHKPGGGTKKIEVQKLEFKDKAKPKIGSLDNVTHKPGGGETKVEEHKLMFKESAKSKVGSMDYISHKPGGGNVQIFDEKTYYKQQQQYGSSKKSSLTSSDDHIEDHQSPSHPKAPSEADDSSKRLSQTNGDHAADVELKDATLGVAGVGKKTEDGLDAVSLSKEIDVVNITGNGGVDAAALQQPSALEVGGKQ